MIYYTENNSMCIPSKYVFKKSQRIIKPTWDYKMSLSKLFIVILLFTIFEGIIGQGEVKKNFINKN